MARSVTDGSARPLGVRVVIAEHLGATVASGAMRVDQNLRVDLEVPGRFGMDIGGGSSGNDFVIGAQQYTRSILADAPPRPRQVGTRRHRLRLRPASRMALAWVTAKSSAERSSSAGRLDKALAEASGLSRERVKGLIAEGAVEIAGTSAKSGSAKVEAGTAFSIALPASRAACRRAGRISRSTSCSKTST